MYGFRPETSLWFSCKNCLIDRGIQVHLTSYLDISHFSPEFDNENNWLRTRRASINAKLTASRSFSPTSPSAAAAEIIRVLISNAFETFLNSAIYACEWLGVKWEKAVVFILIVGACWSRRNNNTRFTWPWTPVLDFRFHGMQGDSSSKIQQSKKPSRKKGVEHI